MCPVLLYSSSKLIPLLFFSREKFCLFFPSSLKIFYFIIHRSAKIPSRREDVAKSIRRHFCKFFHVNPSRLHWYKICPVQEDILNSGLEKFSHWRRFSADLHLSVENAKFLLGNLALNPWRNPFNLLHGMTYDFPRFISCSFSQLKSRFSSLSVPVSYNLMKICVLYL